MSRIFRQRFILLLLVLWPLQTLAADDLDNWRVEMVQVRGLAENDIPQAYRKALHLQSSIPPDATAADRVRLLNLLARLELYRGESESVDHYAAQAMELAAKHNDRIGQAETDLLISMNAVNQSRFDKLKEAIHHSMEMLEGTERTDLRVEAMLRTAMMYLRFGQLDESTKMAMQTLEVAKQTNNPLALTFAHQGMAIVYEQSRNYSEARDQYSKMLRYAQDAHSGLLEADAMLGLGAVLSDMGDATSGERLVNQAVAIYRKTGGPFYMGHALNMQADLQRKLNRLSGALVTLNEAVDIYVQRQNKVGLWWTLRTRSEIQEALHKIVLAQKDAERGYKLAREMGMARYLGESARRLAMLAAKRGEYQKAYTMFAEADEMAKKISFEKNRKRIADLAQQFEEESKKRKIEELIQNNEVQAGRQRWLWTILTGSLILLGLTVFFLLRIRKANSKLQSANAQLDQTRSKLEATLDAVPDLLFEMGLDGTYYDFHSPQAELLILPAEQLLGRKIRDVLPAEASAISLSALQEANERGISLGKQYALDLPQGRSWFETSVARKPTATGESSRFIMLVRDITERKQAERLLHEQEQAIIAVVEHSPDPIARYDRQLRRIYVNPATEKLYGMSYDSIVGQSADELSVLSKDFAAILKSVFESGEELSIELPFRKVDGTEGWGDLRLVPELNADGEIVTVLSIGRDITERRKAEELLREERGLFVGGPTVVFKWRAEEGWPVEYVSHNVQDQFGYAAYQLTDGEIIFGSLIHPDDIEHTTAEVAAYTAQGRTAYEQEYRIAHADGSYRWIYDFTIVSYKENGDVQHFQGYVLDITERKQVEEELRKYREHLEELVEARTSELRENRQILNEGQRIAHVGSWEMNLVDNILTWSDEVYRIFEMDPQQFGASYEAFMNTVHPDDREALDRTFKTSLANHSRFEIEHRLLLPDGRIKYVYECCENYYDNEGRALRALGTVQDITERKQMDEALNESEARYRANSKLLQSVLESSPDVIVFALDRDYRYIAFNTLHRETMRILWGTEIVVGMDMLNEGMGDHPDRVVAKQGFDRALAGESFVTEQAFGDERSSRKYWQTFWSPIRSDAGDILGLTCFVVDITERREMENALRESRQLMAEAQRIARVGSWEYDIANDEHKWSDELFRIYEIDPLQEGASYELCMRTTHPDDHEAIARLYMDAVESGQPYESEHRLLMADGRIKYVHERCEMVLGPDGTLLRAVGMMQDITERKQVEQKLEEALEFSEGVINAIPDILLELDRDGLYLNVWTQNPELLAAQKEALLGRRCTEVLSPEAAAASLEALREADEKGYVQGMDIFIDLPQGRRWFSHTISKKVGGVSGKVTFLALSRDITERKRLEAELLDSRNFLHSVIDAVPDPIFVKDRQHNWILLNEAFCKFISMPREALIGKSDYDVLPAEEADVFRKKDELVFDTGKVNLNEEAFTSADGTKYHIQTKKTPFVSADGSQMLVGVIRDITQRIQYETAREAALVEAQRLASLRSEFIAHMSHELRTPLNGILGYAQMLGRDGKLDAKQLASVEVIRHSGEHLLALIEDILDLARIESGHLKLDFSDIALPTFLNSVIGMISVRARQKKLAFFSDLASDLPHGVRGDEKRLRQVLLNLLSNAVKFTDQGQVSLQVSRVTPSCLRFTIADTGIGIAPEDRDKVFKSFEQVGDKRHRVGGTGLGLAISRQLVCMMGSDIKFESHPGKGSTFNFELELPEVDIAPQALLSTSIEEGRIESTSEELSAESMCVPPPEEMQVLHKLALLGNMRDILQQAEHIAGLDSRYDVFAARLRRLAEGYQSKAILTFIEAHLTASDLGDKPN